VAIDPTLAAYLTINYSEWSNASIGFLSLYGFPMVLNPFP